MIKFLHNIFLYFKSKKGLVNPYKKGDLIELDVFKDGEVAGRNVMLIRETKIMKGKDVDEFIWGAYTDLTNGGKAEACIDGLSNVKFLTLDEFDWNRVCNRYKESYESVKKFIEESNPQPHD